MEETRQREGLLYGNAVQKITEILGVQPEEIKEIEMLKKRDDKPFCFVFL